MISERLASELGDSMRAGRSERTRVLRLLRSALKNEEIKLGHPLNDEEAIKFLHRELKQRRESAEQYRAGAREELAVNEEAEAVIIQEYLPQPMSVAELVELVDEAVSKLEVRDMKQMGAVIGAVMQRAGGRAEGGVVSRLVRERLAA